MTAAGIVAVRPFRLEDLPAAARFCESARAVDPAIEPFGQRLSVVANGSRAVKDLWRVAAGEDGTLFGIAFAAVREPPVFDFYAAVHPGLRRQGLGRALAGPAISSKAVLRVRVPEDAAPGCAFLRALGFAQAGAQLVLHWSAPSRREAKPMPALRIRGARKRDQQLLQHLSSAAWAGAPDAFPSRADEIAQLFGEEGRLVLLAESDGKPLGYLSAVQLGHTLGIEEVAVLPQLRRMGIGRALLAHSLRSQERAVLSVAEANTGARALYRSLGFTQEARRLLFERGRR